MKWAGYRLLQWGCPLFVALACAHAQTPPETETDLDQRSVLLEWSAREKTPAAPTGAVTEAEALTPEQQELEARVDEGLATLGRGLTEEALVIFQQVLRSDPKNKRARFGVGTGYIQQNKYQEAIAVLEPMTEEFPDDFLVKNNVAWLYATARDPTVRNGEKAIRYAQEALLISPNSYQVWNTLSESYYITGEYEKAQRAAEEALRLATQVNAPLSSIADYRRQAEKSARAAKAMSLLD